MKYTTERLQEFRMLQGMSINELAEKSGLSSAQIIRLEKNRVKAPRATTIKKLATALGKEITEFIEVG